MLRVRPDILGIPDDSYICGCQVIIEVILSENADNSVKPQ
jgi:hypothetical protein